MSITQWKLIRNNVALAQIQSFVAGIEQEKLALKSLSGAIYIQTIGSGVKYAMVDVLVTRAEMALVNKAEADGAVISCTYRGRKYVGYIEAAISWSAVMAGEWYTGNFKLLIEEEVAA